LADFLFSISVLIDFEKKDGFSGVRNPLTGPLKIRQKPPVYNYLELFSPEKEAVVWVLLPKT
jgi:hypothetical protein